MGTCELVSFESSSVDCNFAVFTSLGCCSVSTAITLGARFSGCAPTSRNWDDWLLFDEILFAKYAGSVGKIVVLSAASAF